MSKKPEKDYFKLTCLISKTDHRKLKQIALDEESSITAIVQDLITDYLLLRKQQGKKD